MIIQFYRDELDYVNATIAGANDSKSFLTTFCQACLRADSSNYEILRPALAFFMRKYPALSARIAAEREDQGAESR